VKRDIQVAVSQQKIDDPSPWVLQRPFVKRREIVQILEALSTWARSWGRTPGELLVTLETLEILTPPRLATSSMGGFLGSLLLVLTVRILIGNHLGKADTTAIPPFEIKRIAGKGFFSRILKSIETF
jgi:hypothetical protein